MQNKARYLLCLLLALALCVGLPGMGQTARAAGVIDSGKCGPSLTWTFYDNGLLEISGSGPMDGHSGHTTTPWRDYYASISSLSLPNGLTSIGQGAFDHCDSLISVTIPGSVASIGGIAFRDCSSLTSITIPNSVTSIGESAFDGCSSLTSITIPNSVTSIGDYAFDGCSSLTSVTIPNSVTSIGDYAFDGCSSLAGVAIPDSVVSIRTHAFFKCSNLTSVTIPDSVVSIGDSAFSGCNALSEIRADSLASWFRIAALENAPYLNKGGKLYFGGQEAKNVVIPEGVTEIPASAFYNCSGLTTVTIPDSVLSIGESAFENCSGLTAVTIPDSVLSIGESAFKGCTGLLSVSIPDSVLSIGSSAFEGCTGLLRITIPDSVLSIGESAFYGCSSLAGVTIPDSVLSVGASAFRNCTYLTGVLLGNGLSSIGSYTFYGCSSLTNVTIPDSVLSIGDHAFHSCTNLTGAVVGDGVISIGSYAFPTKTKLLKYHPANAATSAKDGNIPYYSCEADGKYYSDITAKTEIAVNSWLIPALGGGPTVSLTDATGVPGGTVEVRVALKDNPGVISMKLEVGYDNSVLTLVNVIDGGLLGESFFDTSYSKNPYTLYWENGTMKTDIKASGSIVTLVFAVRDNAPSGTCPICLTCREAYNAAEEAVDFSAVGCSVTIGGGSLVGDASDDGTVNAKDGIYLARYIAGWSGYAVDTAAADLNLDGFVNAKDGIILARHIAGWTGYETLPYLG